MCARKRDALNLRLQCGTIQEYNAMRHADTRVAPRGFAHYPLYGSGRVGAVELLFLG